MAEGVERRSQWAIHCHVISPPRLWEALQRGYADIISQVRVATDGRRAGQRERWEDGVVLVGRTVWVEKNQLLGGIGVRLRVGPTA